MSESADDRSTMSVPLENDEGEMVVIQQQNQGGERQAGHGEFKDADVMEDQPTAVSAAQARQDEVDRESPPDGASASERAGNADGDPADA